MNAVELVKEKDRLLLDFVGISALHKTISKVRGAKFNKILRKWQFPLDSQEEFVRMFGDVLDIDIIKRRQEDSPRIQLSLEERDYLIYAQVSNFDAVRSSIGDLLNTFKSIRDNNYDANSKKKSFPIAEKQALLKALQKLQKNENMNIKCDTSALDYK